MSEFEQATTVTPRGDGTYDATIHEGWDIMGNANGGYLIALAARAMGWATSNSHIWTAEEASAGGGGNTSWSGVTPGAVTTGLGLCCADNE